MGDFWFEIAIAGIAVFIGLVLGFGMGRDWATSGCRDFGAFKVKDTFYDCKPRPAKQ